MEATDQFSTRDKRFEDTFSGKYWLALRFGHRTSVQCLAILGYKSIARQASERCEKGYGGVPLGKRGGARGIGRAEERIDALQRIYEMERQATLVRVKLTHSDRSQDDEPRTEPRLLGWLTGIHDGSNVAEPRGALIGSS